ncbi:MAG: prepilin-type N-terminal cleavage/methylation domain-containing protein [Clostridia bacterium]|nr:prepilin-type N-terminal cleavage/methylation domain-containing protein [Clostridia bacterium]
MKRSKKGFTLIELLIVIAIIAILAAIAIPTFSAQLNKANAAVDAANLRAATSLAVADYMLEGENIVLPIVNTRF